MNARTSTPFISLFLLFFLGTASLFPILGTEDPCECQCCENDSSRLPCQNEQFKLKLNSVCPSQGSLADRLWFRSARNPTVSVEARVPQLFPLQNPRSRYPAYLSQVGLPNFLEAQAIPTVLMHTHGIGAGDFGPKFQQQIELNYSVLERLEPNPASYNGWSRIWITVYACDDTNINGKCSDEAMSEQISNITAVHQMCHFPEAIALDIWNCK